MTSKPWLLRLKESANDIYFLIVMGIVAVWTWIETHDAVVLLQHMALFIGIWILGKVALLATQSLAKWREKKQASK